MFSCEFFNFLRTPFLTEHLWWLPLTLYNFAYLTSCSFFVFVILAATSLVLNFCYYCFYRFQKQPPRFQKQPPRVVLKKRCFENMQQIYRRTPMPRCDFNTVTLQRSRTSAWVFSRKFTTYFQNTFS